MPQVDIVTAASAADDAAADSMAEFRKEFMPEEEKTPLPVVDEAPEDTPPEPEVEPKPEEKQDEEQEKEQEPETPELPEGFVAIPVLSGDLATEFTLRDSKGDVVDVPDLIVEYKANNRVRKDRYDQVVKLAQVGVFNQDRELSLKRREAEVEAGNAALEDQLSLREAQLEELLANEDVYMAARDRYMASNTPEQQVQRMRQQLEDTKREQAANAEAQAAGTFLNSEVLPSLTTISNALPSVTVAELEDKLAVAMIPMTRNGVVPKSQYDTIRQYILHELAPWAEEAHAARTPKTEPVTPEKKAPDPQQARESQGKKNDVGRAIRPVGRSTTAGTAPRRETAGKHLTVDEAQADAMGEVLASIKHLT